MPNKMERFTQRARRILSLAQEEAERLQHTYIGTEHLLLGLLREEGGVAGHVLRDLGLEYRRVEELVERLTRASQHPPYIPLDLSPNTKKVLEMAVDEARRMGHHYIGTEHLLLGLVRQFEGVAMDVLKRLGISPEEVRRQTRRVLQESPVQPHMPSPKSKSTESETPSSPEASSLLRRRLMGRAAPMQRPHVSMPSEAMKILRLVEDGKITAEEAIKMMDALRLPASIISSTLSSLLEYVFHWSDTQKRYVQIVINDKEGEMPTKLQIPMNELEKNLNLLVNGLFNRQTGHLFDIVNDQTSITVSIEDDDKSDT